MITIRMAGELGDFFIPEFQAECSSVWEAIAAVKANFPKFVSYLADSAARGLGFHIKVGYQSVSEDLLDRPFSRKVRRITITPVPVGSGGGGLFKVILGVALIGLAFTGVGFLGLSPLALGLTGGAMLLGGISAMFGKVKDPNSDEKDGKKSMIFGNPSATIREGGRVPIIYGVHLSSWYIASARVRAYKL